AQVLLKKKSRTNYAVYCKDLTPEEWASLVHDLAAEDAKSRQFDKLTVNGITPPELAKVLGGEPDDYEMPAGSGPLGVNLRQGVDARTGSQLVQNLPKPGTPRTDPSPPDTAPGAKQAVAVPYLPQPGFSREVSYVVKSKTTRPGAVQMLLVLWNPEPK